MLSEQTSNNLTIFLSRTQLQGNEVVVFQAMMQELQPLLYKKTNQDNMPQGKGTYKKPGRPSKARKKAASSAKKTRAKKK